MMNLFGGIEIEQDSLRLLCFCNKNYIICRWLTWDGEAICNPMSFYIFSIPWMFVGPLNPHPHHCLTLLFIYFFLFLHSVGLRIFVKKKKVLTAFPFLLSPITRGVQIKKTRIMSVSHCLFYDPNVVDGKEGIRRVERLLLCFFFLPHTCKLCHGKNT